MALVLQMPMIFTLRGSRLLMSFYLLSLQLAIQREAIFPPIPISLILCSFQKYIEYQQVKLTIIHGYNMTIINININYN